MSWIDYEIPNAASLIFVAIWINGVAILSGKPKIGLTATAFALIFDYIGYAVFIRDEQSANLS